MTFANDIVDQSYNTGGRVVIPETVPRFINSERVRARAFKCERVYPAQSLAGILITLSLSLKSLLLYEPPTINHIAHCNNNTSVSIHNELRPRRRTHIKWQG